MRLSKAAFLLLAVLVLGLGSSSSSRSLSEGDARRSTHNRRVLQAGCPCGPRYTIQSGDGLAAIAAKCGAPMQEIAAANNIANVDLIFAGAVLTIPGCNGDSQGPTTNGSAPGGRPQAPATQAPAMPAPVAPRPAQRPTATQPKSPAPSRPKSPRPTTPQAPVRATSIQPSAPATQTPAPQRPTGRPTAQPFQPPPSESPRPVGRPTAQPFPSPPPSQTSTQMGQATGQPSGQHFILYTTDWAVYRNTSDKDVQRPDWCGPYAYTPANIDPSLPTHINFAFAMVNPDTYQVEHTDKAKDPLLIQELQALKQSNPNLKTLISIAGWSFSTGTELFKNADGSNNRDIAAVMVQVATEPSARATFISSAIQYMQQYGFDGIDLDWEFPNFYNYNCFVTEGCPDHITGFSDLVAEMRQALPSGYLLTAAMRATPTPADHYDLAALTPHLDLFNLMSYDFHGAFDDPKRADVHTPMLDCASDKNFHIHGAVAAFLDAGIPSSKLVLGLGAYGRAVKLAPGTTDFTPGQAEFTEAAPAGECTVQPGSLAWYEIKRKLAGKEPSIDPVKLAAYATYDDDQHWVGFDNQESLRLKMCYSRQWQLGGFMLWDAESDDDLELTRYIRAQMDAPQCNGFAMPSCGGSGANVAPDGGATMMSLETERGCPEGVTCTEVRVSQERVPLGRLKPSDIVEKAREACDTSGCSAVPIEIRTEVWEKGHTPGSTYQQKCDLARSTGNEYACGYFTEGTCSVKFDGGIPDGKTLDALIGLLNSAADLSSAMGPPPPDSPIGWGVLSPHVAYPYSLNYCTYWLAGNGFFNDCEIRLENEPVLAMPQFIRAQRWIPTSGNQSAQAGSISMTVSCASDPPGQGWECEALRITNTLISQVTPLYGAVLGTISAVCDRL